MVGIAGARWFVWPRTDQPVSADAIIMLAGGRGERLPVASSIADHGFAPVLVIMNGTDPGWPQANALCAGSFAYEVICPVPSPDNTRGEVQAAGDLAAEKGWDSVILVTSDYHIHRSTTMLERCFDGQINSVAAVGDLGIPARTRSIAREVAALPSLWLSREC